MKAMCRDGPYFGSADGSGPDGLTRGKIDDPELSQGLSLQAAAEDDAGYQ